MRSARRPAVAGRSRYCASSTPPSSIGRKAASPETLNLGNGGLAATAKPERIEFSFGVQAFTDTFLYANARLERNGSNDLLHLPLTGDMRARAADANILPLVFPEVDHAAGLLTANANISGTLAEPEINGRSRTRARRSSIPIASTSRCAS